jgi:hypothetical protein
MKSVLKNGHFVIVFSILCVILILMLLQNTNMIKSILRINKFDVGREEGTVISSLVYGVNGYEMIISGQGDMSEYTPREWTENLVSLSSGWKISIKKVTVEEGVSSISSGAFWGCSDLEAVSLPHSIEKIGTKAFADCYLLENIKYNGKITEWCDVMDNSPLWNGESSIKSVICLDGNCNTIK